MRSRPFVQAGEHHLRLLRMRASADLEGIEVGPELGRGSYGRVYKGACITYRLCHPMRCFMRHFPRSAFACPLLQVEVCH